MNDSLRFRWINVHVGQIRWLWHERRLSEHRRASWTFYILVVPTQLQKQKQEACKREASWSTRGSSKRPGRKQKKVRNMWNLESFAVIDLYESHHEQTNRQGRGGQLVAWVHIQHAGPANNPHPIPPINRFITWKFQKWIKVSSTLN